MKIICPRCETPDADVIARSPVKGAWDMYLCGTCLFSWRSTEPQKIQDPALYNPAFKINPDDIANFDNVPEVPEQMEK